MKRKMSYALMLCILTGSSVETSAKAELPATADYCTYAGNCKGEGAFASRYLNSVTMSGSDGDRITISKIQSPGGVSPVYYDRTGSYIMADAGAVITPSIVWNGGWMHAYMYIDYNNDGTFSQVLSSGKKPATGDEVVSFSYFNGVNSLGVTSGEGAGISTTSVPAFTLPEGIAKGDYRVRLKIDWNSLDPCGASEIAKNVGCIVDFTLRVGTPVKRYVVTAENKMSDYKLVWEDEFEGTGFNTNTWTKIPPVTYPPPDWRKYISTSDALFGMDNGQLILRGLKNDGIDPSDSRPYLCGGVESMDKKTFEGGRLEVRAKVSSATGAWPAIWLMPADGGTWPMNGEIDIMEHLNYDAGVYQTVHNWYTQNMGGTVPQKSAYTAINRDGWNTYATEMLQDTVKFFVNGKQTLAYPRNGVENQFPYNRAFYMLIDMQLGGSWVGNVDVSKLPVEMRIDYVRHYKKHSLGGLISIEDVDGNPVNLGSTFLDGTTLCAKVTPEEGYTLKAVYVNGENVMSQYDPVKGYTFKLTNNVTISADYETLSISSPSKRDKHRVLGQKNGIMVSCEGKTAVAVFTMEGRLLAKSVVNGSRMFKLPSGSYIVKMGDEKKKVMVK